MGEDDKGKQNADAFFDSSIYPDAASIFSFGLESIDAIKNDCIVVLDTNALLIPYTITKESLDQITNTYKSLITQKRLILPGQAAREFANNRPRKLTDLYYALSQKRSNHGRISEESYPLLGSTEEYRKILDLAKEINKQLDEYDKSIGQMLEIIRGWRWNDPVSITYKELFTEDVMFDLPINNENIKKDFEKRKQQNIPPGYKDSRPGDLIIWHTILEIGKRDKKSLIFVSGDDKADWFHKSNKEPLYPRYELVDEFRRASGGQSFHIVSFSSFLSLFGASPQTVEEVRQEEAQTREIREGTPRILENPVQSDVGVGFSVLYNLHPGKAKLRVREETRGAMAYGVQYQIGIESSDGDRRFSPPLPFDEVLVTEVEGDLINGEKLILRMVDNNYNHLAAAGIDRENWPSNVSEHSVWETFYWLYVPPERLKVPIISSTAGFA